MIPSAMASEATDSTSGSAAIRPIRLGSIVAKSAVAEVTTRSARSPSRTSVPMALVSELAMTENIVTMAVPSISASAVDDARRGLDARLPAAITPRTPATRRVSGALQRAAAVTIAGPHSTSAGTIAAVNTSHAALVRTTAVAPPTTAIAASTSPIRVRVVLTTRCSAAPSRNASIGGVAAARRAGIQAERSVAPIPTAEAMTIEAGCTIAGPVSRVTPVSPNSQRSTPTPARPNSRPSAVATVPMNNASITTPPST